MKFSFNNMFNLTDNYVIQNRKKMLTKLLATENLRVVFKPDIKTAYFESKRRLIALPIWKEGISNELLDMLCVHETGHALYTPGEFHNKMKQLAEKYKIKNSFVQAAGNIIEDIRINELQKIRYPGSRRDFLIGYKQRYDRGDYGGESNFINNLPFLDRVNVHFKVGEALGVVFTEEEKPYVQMLSAVRTAEDVYAAVEAVIHFIAEQMQPKTDDHQQGDDDDGDGDDESESNDGNGEDGEEIDVTEAEIEFEDGDDNEGNDESDGDESDADGNEGDQDAEEGKDAKPGKSKKGGSGKQKPDKIVVKNGGKQKIKLTPEQISKILANVAESKTVEAEEKANAELIEKYTINVANGSSFYNAEIAEYDVKCIVSWQDVVRKVRGNSSKEEANRKSYYTFAKEELHHINFMLNIFEMKKQANSFKRAQEAKTGMLNMNKIYKYQISEDIFQRSMVQKEGKNHGFVFLLDTSSSMDLAFHETLRQTVLMAIFCKRLGVPFAFYAFNSNGYYGGNGWKTDTNNGIDSLPGTQRFSLTEFLHSDMPKSEFEMVAGAIINKSCHSWLNSSGGTPLNSSILAMRNVCDKFLEKNKVDVFNFVTITDGEAGDRLPFSKALVDPKSKLEMDTTNTSSDSNATKMALDFLRARIKHGFPEMDIKAISFFIGNSGNLPVKVEKKSVSFGYDERYVLNSGLFTSRRRDPFSETFVGNLDSQLKQLQASLEHQKYQRVFSKYIVEKVAQTV